MGNHEPMSFTDLRVNVIVSWKDYILSVTNAWELSHGFQLGNVIVNPFDVTVQLTCS